MSEESEVNSSVLTNEECKNNSASSTSSDNKINSSTITMSDECKVDSCTSITNDNNKINLSTFPMKEESKINSSSMPLSEDNKGHSSINSKSEDSEFNPAILSTEKCTDNSSSSSTREGSKIYSSTVPITVDKFESSFTLTTSDDTETHSSGSSYQLEIEESILKMIKHIENEIECDQHVGLNENDFQNVEIKIKTSRVMVAIEQTIRKLEIAFCLQWMFVENVYDINVLCGETNMNKLINEYCKVRDVEDMDVCRFQPIVINCINDAFEAGLGRFVDLHRHKVDAFIHNY